MANPNRLQAKNKQYKISSTLTMSGNMKDEEFKKYQEVMDKEV
ncbi:hypothetical protein [Paenibacillus larvae]|nr:hypothetical protein [Paenibacillus larvae]MDV3486587.1 hypothetical protein [Paenibacillus larvae]